MYPTYYTSPGRDFEWKIVELSTQPSASFLPTGFAFFSTIRHRAKEPHDLIGYGTLEPRNVNTANHRERREHGEGNTEKAEVGEHGCGRRV